MPKSPQAFANDNINKFKNDLNRILEPKGSEVYLVKLLTFVDENETAVSSYCLSLEKPNALPGAEVDLVDVVVFMPAQQYNQQHKEKGDGPLIKINGHNFSWKAALETCSNLVSG